MQAEARVMRLEGDHAIVELIGRRDGGCGRCHEPGGCGGSAAIGQFFGSRDNAFRVLNGIGAQPGERVFLQLGEGVLLRVALLTYLLPMVTLVTGAFVGMTLFPHMHDLAAAAGGIVGLGIPLIAVSRFQARRARAIEPVLTRHPSSCSQ